MRKLIKMLFEDTMKMFEIITNTLTNIITKLGMEAIQTIEYQDNLLNQLVEDMHAWHKFVKELAFV